MPEDVSRQFSEKSIPPSPRNRSRFQPGSNRTAHEDTCKQAGIADFTLHDFRHTCINTWRKAHHDYFKIMAASGHKTISVFKRYNLVDETEVKTLVEDSQMDTYMDTTAQKAK